MKPSSTTASSVVSGASLGGGGGSGSQVSGQSTKATVWDATEFEQEGLVFLLLSISSAVLGVYCNYGFVETCWANYCSV
jgi:hypothetical protein